MARFKITRADSWARRWGQVALASLLSVFVVSGLAWAYGAVALWDGAFEATPPDAESVSQGDDAIREFKGTVRNYAEAEMNWGTAGDNNGRMREGSARAFYANADPTNPTALNGTDINGSAAIGANDDGRLLRRSDTGELKVYTGSAWAQALTSLSGTINLINTPLFAGTSGGLDTFDPREFTIRGIYVDTTTDASVCAAGASLSATVLGSQTFGDAGAACFTSGAINLSARSTTNSRALVMAQFNITATPASCTVSSVSWGVFMDGMGTQIGPAIPLIDTQSVSTMGNGGVSDNPVLLYYTTTLSSASHEFAIHATSSDTDCKFIADATSGNYLAVIDLGPDY